jgi:tetratricopeptide (TPR) repeat protein
MLNDLAALYVAKGDYRASLPPYERMLKIREVALGPDHLDVAKALHWLGAVNELMVDYELAESRQQRALEIRQKALGSDLAPNLRSDKESIWVTSSSRW